MPVLHREPFAACRPLSLRTPRGPCATAWTSKCPPRTSTAAKIADLRFYFGPNDADELSTSGWGEIGRVIDFGWWIFGWINRNLIFPFYGLLAKVIGSAGLIVLIMTLCIKTLLAPITWKNYVSSAKMKVLKPDMEALNAKYPDQDDAVLRQQETMKLYRDSGVNPLAGCIPQLIQMPLLYAMFRFFPANIELRGKSFLWADDLGAFDSILDLPFEIPFYGAHVSGFTLLMATSMFFYMGQTMSQQAAPTQPGMPDMRIMAKVMPFFMLFFFNKFASGLSLYYFIANLVTIGQVSVVKRFFIDEDKIREKIKEKQATPKPEKKKGGFAQRLEAMQKDQQKRADEMKQQRDQSRKSRNQKRKKVRANASHPSGQGLGPRHLAPFCSLDGCRLPRPSSLSQGRERAPFDIRTHNVLWIMSRIQIGHSSRWPCVLQWSSSHETLGKVPRPMAGI